MIFFNHPCYVLVLFYHIYSTTIKNLTNLVLKLQRIDSALQVGGKIFTSFILYGKVCNYKIMNAMGNVETNFYYS